MRYLTALAALLILPSLALAQDDDFQISGELKLKYFVVNDVPDIVMSDYSGYSGAADAEISFSAHLKILEKLEVDGAPYMWLSVENNISRLGFLGTTRYEILEDFKVGYGHHSWHNVDMDSAGWKQAQDWLFLEWNFWDIEIDKDKKYEANFYLEPRWYFNNGEFIQAKDFYDRDDPTAFAEISLHAIGNYKKLSWDIRPYFQLATDAYRFGVESEISYSIKKYLAAFISVDYYATDEDDRTMIGIDLMIKFK